MGDSWASILAQLEKRPGKPLLRAEALARMRLVGHGLVARVEQAAGTQFEKLVRVTLSGAPIADVLLEVDRLLWQAERAHPGIGQAISRVSSTIEELESR